MISEMPQGHACHKRSLYYEHYIIIPLFWACHAMGRELKKNTSTQTPSSQSYDTTELPLFNLQNNYYFRR